MEEEMIMTDPKHFNSEIEDVEDVLKKIEESFDISFEPDELAHVRTFGELCDHILPKIGLQHIDDCTNQQAFYKLRVALLAMTSFDKRDINTNTEVALLFPRRGRRRKISELETLLGFKLNILTIKDLFLIIFLLFMLISGIYLIFNWMIGLAGIFLSFMFLNFINKTGIELNVKTLGEVAEKMTLENYTKVRRYSGTYNKKEVIFKIEKLFINDLGLKDKFKEIPPDTFIVER